MNFFTELQNACRRVKSKWPGGLVGALAGEVATLPGTCNKLTRVLNKRKFINY